MAVLRKRVERLEKSLRPALCSSPREDMNRLALERVSTDDLMVLMAIGEQGKPQGEWTEPESAAVKALAGAFDQEVLRAGYRTGAEFQRNPFAAPKASHRRSLQSVQACRVVG